MQNTQQPKSLEKIFAAIAANIDSKRLQVQRLNAVERNVPEVVGACDRRLAELKQHAITTRRARAKAMWTSLGVRYRGAFPGPLTKKLRGEQDRRIPIWLPLAKEAGRKDRGRVAGAIRLGKNDRIIVENLDRGTQHSSLSNFRADYEAEGGGTDSWSSFETVDGTSIAKYVGVDPARAHESLGD